MDSYRNQPIGTVPRSRQFRREASEPERRLLRSLREAFPHLKWRHQVPIGPFYADLLCFSEKLVIEVDGETHVSSGGYDADRTAFIARKGFRVIRFANADVMRNLHGVLARMSFSLQEKEGAANRRKDEGDRTKEKGAPA